MWNGILKGENFMFSMSDPMGRKAIQDGLDFDLRVCIEEKKQAAADVLFQYSKFAMACIGNQVRPCDLRLHLMKEISGMPTSLKRHSPQAAATAAAASPDAMGESSSSGNPELVQFEKVERTESSP
ncbi:hypothetical protein CCACVL1_26989 [Corchorus capsularis]|uniref:Uncharacterized protein n=1 Tax=Corchorus capsularis TaxID=210143 RepID=A0A1R3GCK6_COCAP|nr:hypothetical protein CCACVL1_26989 [Corchorus capsularis]